MSEPDLLEVHSIQSATIKQHGKLMAHMQCGAVIDPVIQEEYEKQLVELTEKVSKGDDSDFVALLASQALAFNSCATLYLQHSEALAYEGCVAESALMLKMAISCADRSAKAFKLTTTRNKPAKQVWIKTMNQQINNTQVNSGYPNNG